MLGIDSAFIPLYLNNDFVNHVYTILVSVFIETKTCALKNHVKVLIDTPISELMRGGPCKEFIQGDIHFEFFDEYSFAYTRERISIQILVLVEVIDMLMKSKMLKKIKTQEDLDSIKENDFIEMECTIKQNPKIEKMENMIKIMETENLLNQNSNVSTEFISNLKTKINEIKNNECLRYVAGNFCESGKCAVVPIVCKYLGDNLNYALDSKVKLLGKVVKVAEDENSEEFDLCTGSCLDFLEDDFFEDFKDTYLKDSKNMHKYNKIMEKLLK